MISISPKKNTLFSIAAFLLIAYGIVFYQLFKFTGAIYQYILIVILTPIALGITLKVTLGYKTMELGKGKVKVKYPFLFRKKDYKMNELSFWTETTIDTRKGQFKELALKFKERKAERINNQEHLNYDKLYRYMKKNFPKKQFKP
ncbi:hypothetical protein [Xanthovirga aplysinae]|uniref:hypothetical protein n=1 Tax=Xanthovirga aplysinae TaxID=2529853 RepID=UPI0012BD6553|nr:hypothetical protein [Xanthovirga aplysinae]MTI31762.1 hypothetical protein [Xanthovirga aplysinae]